MNRKAPKMILSFLFVAALLLTSCAQAAPTQAPAEEAPAASTADEEYIYVSMMGNLEFFNAHKYGFKWAGEGLGVPHTYVGPPDFDVNAQVAAFDQAIAKKPKGIVVFGVDPALIPEINKASDAGIPVVTILGDLPTPKQIALLG